MGLFGFGFLRRNRYFNLEAQIDHEAAYQRRQADLANAPRKSLDKAVAPFLHKQNHSLYIIALGAL
jgi:hypothetical protein